MNNLTLTPMYSRNSHAAPHHLVNEETQMSLCGRYATDAWEPLDMTAKDAITDTETCQRCLRSLNAGEGKPSGTPRNLTIRNAAKYHALGGGDWLRARLAEADIYADKVTPEPPRERVGQRLTDAEFRKLQTLGKGPWIEAQMAKWES